MPPRLYLFSGGQALCTRTTGRVASPAARIASPTARLTSRPSTRQQQLRYISANEKPLPEKDEQSGTGPNQDQLPHVSEEAGAMGDITGEGGPDLEHGTPLQEMISRDKEAQKNAPEVLKGGDSKTPQSQYTDSPGSKRSFSTSTRRRQPELFEESSRSQPPPPPSSSSAPMAIDTSTRSIQEMFQTAWLEQGGLKFGLPSKPYDKTDHLQKRYHPLVDQLTKLMMRDGKKAAAQRNMEIILTHLQTAPPPKPSNDAYPILQSYYNPPVTNYFPAHASAEHRRLISSPDYKPVRPAVPDLIPQHLPLDPIRYLELAIDACAPMVKIRAMRGILGGGAAMQVPTPLPQKQRRRTAMEWILQASEKRKEVRLADRVAREIVAVVEGKSSVWGKRELVHKQGVSTRSNVRFLDNGGRGGMGMRKRKKLSR